MVAAMLKQTRMTILLSLNAVAIVIAGLLIASALGWQGLSLHVVDERSDVTSETAEQVGLIDSGDAAAAAVNNGAASAQGVYASANGGVSSDPVPDGELWSENAITMYQTADFDICVGGGLTGLGDMYWQTSNNNVISGFYASARTWLGYKSETCRYPIIKGTGTTTITAGTYDGARNDTLTVTVVAPPVEQWKREVLALVNAERAKAGLRELAWGATCENAATKRAEELKTSYSHTRPDGTSWATACPLPVGGGVSGENLAAGNGAVTPATVVNMWMNSETHRANILNDKFTRLAVGFVFEPNSQYKTYWSEYFTNY